MKNFSVVIIAMWIISVALAGFFGYLFFTTTSKVSSLQNENVSLQSQLESQQQVLGLTKTLFQDTGLGIKLSYPNSWDVINYQTETDQTVNIDGLGVKRYSITLQNHSSILVFSKNFVDISSRNMDINTLQNYYAVTPELARYQSSVGDIWQYGTIVLCDSQSQFDTPECVNNTILGFSTSTPSNAGAFVQSTDESALSEADQIVMESLR